MVTQTYYHDEMDSGVLHVDRIIYAGKEVLVRHYSGVETHNKKIELQTIVVGFVRGKYMRQKKDSLPVTTVTLITDSAQRRDITDLLVQRGLHKPISFWH